MKEIIREGVVAELDGKFWGIQYQDSYCTSYDFGDLANATIGDPKYCKKPTDMTYTDSPYTEKLLKSRLVRVRKTIRVEIV